MPTEKDPRDGRWRYRFKYKGVRYSGSSPPGNNTKGFAAQLEKEHLERLQARTFTGIMPSIAEFAPRFLAYQQAHTKQLTHEMQESIVRLHIVPHIGKLKLDQVRRAQLDELKSKWAGAGTRTINTRLGVAQRMLSLAAEWEILTAAPRTRNLKVPDDHPRFLSEDEASALVTVTAEHYPGWHAMVVVALRTGLRIGELRGLQWGDVDFARALLSVRRTDPGRADMDAGAPKGNRPRIVPLTGDAIAALRAELARVPPRTPTSWVWPGAPTWRKETGRDRTRSEGNCAEMMGRMAKRAGLDEEVTWHTLRHTYASWLVMRGVPLSAVQELLGHANIKQTMRYAHLSPGFAQHAAVAALDLPLVRTPAPAQLTSGSPLPTSEPARSGSTGSEQISSTLYQQGTNSPRSRGRKPNRDR